MGWETTASSTPRQFRDTELRDYFREDLKVVETSITGNELYYAIKDKQGAVSGGVIMFQKFDGRQWMKLITEDMGPYYYACPNKILKLLTPTDNQHALEWRRMCRRQIAWDRRTRSDRKRLDELPPGTVIRYRGELLEAVPNIYSRTKHQGRTLFKKVGSASYVPKSKIARWGIEIASAAEKKAQESWASYIRYLSEWGELHRNPEFSGKSPASFEEFLAGEPEEE